MSDKLLTPYARKRKDQIARGYFNMTIAPGSPKKVSIYRGSGRFTKDKLAKGFIKMR